MMMWFLYRVNFCLILGQLKLCYLRDYFFCVMPWMGKMLNASFHKNSRT